MFVLSYRTASRLGPPPHHPTGVALRAAREGKGRQGAPKVWLQIFFKELNRIKAKDYFQPCPSNPFPTLPLSCEAGARGGVLPASLAGGRELKGKGLLSLAYYKGFAPLRGGFEYIRVDTRS